MTPSEIKIIAEPQTDPATCQFTIDRELTSGPTIRFLHADQAKGSKLAEEIFAVGNVSQIMVSARVITVTQSAPEEWPAMGKRIGGAIRQAAASGSPLISDELKKTVPASEIIREKVMKVLTEQINPAVASHGGFIELVDVKNNDIFIKMGGGCQGCASSTATLRQGVEQSLRREVPELGAIYDTTNHSAGDSPYY